MKKFLLGLAMVGMVAGVSTNAFAATSGTGQAIVNHNVKLHSTPRLANNSIETLYAGDTMRVLSQSNGWLHVQASDGNEGYVVNQHYYVTVRAANTVSNSISSQSSNMQTTSASQSTYNFQLPQGVTLDPSITPLAGINASIAQKEQAVMQVAISKMGTPYIWGHNEDRGQYGFDCSNFTSYVYHHALGYKMSGSSRVQASSVGNPISRSQMQVGDLLIFDNGHHVGIYAGNDQVIQEGGGLGKVGYLSIAPGKYWSNHITAVKRMF